MKRFVALAAVVALVAAACGGSEDEAAGEGVASLAGSSSTTTSTTPVDTEQALLQFTACMREHGIDLQDPTVDADGNVILPRPVPPEGGFTEEYRQKAVAARDACVQYLEGLSLGFERLQDPEFQDRILEFAQCMRDNGYDMPDPDFSALGSRPGPGGGIFERGAIDPSDPDFQTALESCQDILAGFTRVPGRIGPGTTTTTP